MAVGHVCALFVALAIRSQVILPRLANWRLYGGPHVQEYMAGCGAECKELLERQTLGVRNALEEGIQSLFFAVEAALAVKNGASESFYGSPLNFAST